MEWPPRQTFGFQARWKRRTLVALSFSPKLLHIVPTEWKHSVKSHYDNNSQWSTTRHKGLKLKEKITYG